MAEPLLGPRRTYPVQETKTFPSGSTVAPPAWADPGLNSGFTFAVKNVTPPSCEAAELIVRPWLNVPDTSFPRPASTGLSASPLARKGCVCHIQPGTYSDRG